MNLIKLSEKPEQIELIKAMGSKNPQTSREATEAVAAFLTPVIKEVLKTLGTASRIYRDAEFDEDADPSIPLDLFYNEGAGYITVWSQHMAGGLPTSQVSGVAELKFATYRLDSAVSFNKRYARKSRLDVVSRAIERLLQEVLIKQERNAWAVVVKALAEASTTPVGGSALKHAFRAASAGSFQLKDLNSLMVRIKRINESFSGNTPVQPYSNGITDLFVSPEIKAQIRAFAYNPVDTSAANTVQNLPENLREEIYRNAGMQSIYGVNINELIELGVGKKYNTLFDTAAGSTAFTTAAGGGSATFNGSAEEILLGVDNTRGAFIRPVARNAETGSTFSVLPDGQFDMYGSRVEKVGWYGSLEEGRICIDGRAVAGIIV